MFAVCTAVIATVALAFLLLPMCQYLVRPCHPTHNKISLGICGRFTLAELVSVAVSIGELLLLMTMSMSMTRVLVIQELCASGF